MFLNVASCLKKYSNTMSFLALGRSLGGVSLVRLGERAMGGGESAGAFANGDLVVLCACIAQSRVQIMSICGLEEKGIAQCNHWRERPLFSLLIDDIIDPSPLSRWALKGQRLSSTIALGWE